MMWHNVARHVMTCYDGMSSDVMLVTILLTNLDYLPLYSSINLAS